MGQGGRITLVNSTSYDWNKSYEHSYQMNSWSFPQTIPAGTAATVYVEWDQSIFHHTSDDGGEATYSMSAGGVPLSFQVQARASNGFNLQIAFLNIATQNNPQGSVLPLGWDHDGYVNFILAGQIGSFTSSNPLTSWMQSNLTLLRQRTLRQLCLPGSHDSGMSQNHAHTAFGQPCNTITQTLNLFGQLTQGARYFDIRPVISGGAYYTGHYSEISALNSWQGANGQSIASIISDVNAYTASNGELVILNLSHDLNTDVGNGSYRPFNQDEWNALLTALEGINNRYIDPNPTTVDLSNKTLGSYIDNRQARVLIIVQPSDSTITLGNFAAQGFYTNKNFSVYDSYTGTNDLNHMSSDQVIKMKEQRTSQNSNPFLLSWTLTQSDTQAATCFTLPGVDSILDLANTANPALPSMLWPSLTSQCYPNILYTDNVSNSQNAALALAINWMASSAALAHSGSPFIPAGSYNLSSQDISVKLEARCFSAAGVPVTTSITYTAGQAVQLCDISNQNGELTLAPAASGATPSMPTPSGNPFIPAGSYILTGQPVSITINASCRNVAGQLVKSSVTFDATQAASLLDISNQNGQLILAME
ncbi:hypothetical protein BUE93_08535 [Chromobacterium amazonense]|uniref:Phosphatidylinositol diacylglycerol-lyase n=1 Tax=Chromobacterium amazonense TaxID=1382803 RepID=A0A2S9X5P2_9NEIS|nr:hypothetical protein [Chromobacterium amazonense]PRP70995.1 hypothetical protein BUE93_08535 [Chromobacterium amazonense]